MPEDARDTPNLLALLDGRVVHVSELSESDRGKKCRAVCAHCGERLWAKMGLHRRWHFAHPSGAACDAGTESALHLCAKEILERRRAFMMPAVDVRVEDEVERVRAPERLEVEQVLLEYDYDGLRPDAVMVHNGRHQLLVEIRMAHPCSPEKVERIRRMGIGCVEVDVRGLRIDSEAFDREGLEVLLVDQGMAEKAWIFAPSCEEVEARIRARLLERARSTETDRSMRASARAARDAEVRQRAEQAALAKAQERAAWLRLLETDATWQANREALGVDGEPPSYLAQYDVPEVRTFACPPPAWQSDVWVRHLLVAADGLVVVGEIVDAFLCDHPDWVAGPTVSREIVIRDRAATAIGSYLNRLAGFGFTKAIPPHYANDPASWVWAVVARPASAISSPVALGG